MGKVENAIAAAFQDFDFVVEAFDKPAILALDKVVGNFILPHVPQLQEWFKTGQSAGAHFFHPPLDFRLRLSFRQGAVKDGGQLLPQLISLLGGRGVLEKSAQRFPFLLI